VKKKVLVLFIAFTLLLMPLFAVSHVARADDSEVHWRSPKSINGGFITSLQKMSDGALIASTDAAIFESTDSGKTWEKLPFTFSEGANAVLISKNYYKNGLFLGTKDGVFLSRDKGEHFQFFNMGLESSDIIGLAEDPNGDIFALSFDGLLMKWLKKSELWKTIGRFSNPVGTAIFATADYVYVGCEDGTVYRTGLDGSETEKIIDSVTTSPVSKIICENGTFYISTFHDGMFIGSPDNLTHMIKGYKINDFVLDSDNIYAATVSNGIMKYDGNNWTNLTKSNGLILSAICISNGTIFVGTEGNGIYRLENGGLVKSSYGITCADITTINFSTNYTNDGTVFVGTKWNGLYESTDKGKTFTSVASFPSGNIVTSVCGNNSTYFVGTEGNGLYKTTDGGQTFNKADIDTNYVSVMFENNGVIYVGSGDKGMFVSTDGGKTFEQRIKGMLPYDTNVTAIDSSGNAVFIGTNGGTVYETLNQGKMWTPIGFNTIPHYTIADISLSRNFSTDQTLIVGTMGAGLYLSKDGGNSFTNISDALLKFHMWDDGVKLSPDFANDHIILAGSWDGVYLSFDEGNMWTNINGDKDNRYVFRTVFSPDFVYKKSGAIFVGTESGGLYVYDQKSSKIVVKMVIDQKGMTVNGKFVPTDVPPVIKNNRTLVPIRFVTEAVGAQVGWDPQERKVTITLNNNKVELYIGKNTAYVNGIPKQIDPNNPKVVPIIIHNRTYVPIRFIMEAFGAQVEWDGTTRTVTIIYGG
jgi:photosystem II stability/assembly factor-like uncharacterized protein